MIPPPTVTFSLDSETFEVLTQALEQHAAHREQQIHEPLLAPTAQERMRLFHEVAYTDQMRRTVEDALSAGQVHLPLDPVTFEVLSAALSSYHDDQQQEAAEATHQCEDPDSGGHARGAAALADRLHLQALEAAYFPLRPST
jgi:protein involved in temperature-dependent protein secretion